MKKVKNSAKLTACAVAFVSGGIGVFAYSPFDYWWISFISAAGLVWIATQFERRAALWTTFLWGVSYFAFGVNWVQVSMIQFGGVPEIVSYVAVLILAAYLALYPLLFTYIVGRFRVNNPWVMATVFTFTEYLREVVFTGFPWLQLGYSLIDSPFFGIAPIFGVEGLTFFVLVASGYFVQIFCNSAKKLEILTACVSLFVLIVGGAVTQRFQFVEVNTQQKPLAISLLQGNIEQKMKWDPNHFQETIRTYERLFTPLLGKSDLIIFPESAIPAVEQQIAPLLAQLHQAGVRHGTEMIIGTLYQSDNGLFNSAVALGNPEQPYSLETSPRYNKHHLVPFGEYVPFGRALDWLRDVFILPVNLSQGEFIQKPLLAANHRFTMAICYEIIYSEQVQKNAKAYQSDYLLTISNDAWFGESIGPWQHFQIARMRALELGKPLIRATSTGVTAFIDHKGKVLAEVPQFSELALTYTLPVVEGKTFFAEWGRRGIWAIGGVILLLAVIGRMQSRRR